MPEVDVHQPCWLVAEEGTAAWIYERFTKHHMAKAYHEPWKAVGDALWDASLAYDERGFVLAGLRALGVNERYA